MNHIYIFCFDYYLISMSVNDSYQLTKYHLLQTSFSDCLSNFVISIFWFDFVSINSINQCFVSFFFFKFVISLIFPSPGHTQKPHLITQRVYIFSKLCIYAAWWLCQEIGATANTFWHLKGEKPVDDDTKKASKLLRKTTACLQCPRPFPLLD